MIIQVWISTPFGVLSERLLTADETFPFIDSTFTRCRLRCKACSSAFRLLPPKPLLQNRQKPPTREATARPYTRHILGIDSGVQSHYKATPKLLQGSYKAPTKLASVGSSLLKEAPLNHR